MFADHVDRTGLCPKREISVSNTPPPFGQPPGPAGGVPGVPGPPAWQTGPGSGGLNPEPAPSGRSKLPIVIGLVVVAAIVVLVVLLSSGDDDGAKLDSAAASAGMAAIFEDSDGFQASGVDLLNRCPLGRVAALIEVSGAVLSKDAQDADDVAVLYTDDGVSSAACLQRYEESSDGSDGLAGISFLGSSEPARNFSSWFENFVVGDEGQDPKIDDEQSFASGTVYSGCTDVQCSAWWNDEENDVAFGVQLNSDEVEAGDAVTILKKALPTLVANLAENAPS